MGSSGYILNVAIWPQLIIHLQEAIDHRPPKTPKGTARACLAAEKVGASEGLSKLRAALPSKVGSLDIFTWDLILGELARYYLATGLRDAVFNTTWKVRQAMHADPYYQSLLVQAKEYDRKQKRLEEIKRRFEQDKAVLLEEYRSTGDCSISRVLSLD